MQTRNFAHSRTTETNLPALLDQLEVALKVTPPRTALCRALSELNRSLGAASDKAAARTSRRAPSRRRREMVVESLPLFS
ncbi:hypothetical protein P3T16_006379 [Paraburkholderia sp. GAS42]|jgi:hypothetical protein